MNFRYLIFYGLAFLVSACAVTHEPIRLPMLITGIVTKPQHTGWYRDYCSAGELVDFPPSRGNCILHGGEIYKVKLLKPRDLSGNSLGDELTIGYPAHALDPDYVWPRKSLFLVSSPADFAAKTGIFFYTPTYGIYDARDHCVNVDGYAHADFRNCVDQSFHETNKGKCISIGDYLAHYELDD